MAKSPRPCECEFDCPDARERAGPVFPPVGEEETQTQRARARRDNEFEKVDKWYARAQIRETVQLKLTYDARQKSLEAVSRPGFASPGRDRTRGPYIVVDLLPREQT